MNTSLARSRDERVDSSFIPDALVGWLMARSLGHPLFVIGLLDALAAEAADLSSPRLDRLLSNLADRVTLGLHMLELEDLTILEALAVLDQWIGYRRASTDLRNHLSEISGPVRFSSVSSRSGPHSLAWQ